MNMPMEHCRNNTLTGGNQCTLRNPVSAFWVCTNLTWIACKSGRGGASYWQEEERNFDLFQLLHMSRSPLKQSCVTNVKIWKKKKYISFCSFLFSWAHTITTTVWSRLHTSLMHCYIQPLQIQVGLQHNCHSLSTHPAIRTRYRSQSTYEHLQSEFSAGFSKIKLHSCDWIEVNHYHLPF